MRRVIASSEAGATAAAHLNPDHPSLAGLDRAAIQRLMQHRAKAKQNISEGRTGTIVEVDHSEVFPGELIFSPCGNRIVVMDDHEFSAYAVKDGRLLWRNREACLLQDDCLREVGAVQSSELGQHGDMRAMHGTMATLS
ncbi:hypothetical protein WJX73_001675 [Symbiochloris irregularis]|uniref:Uncharacterized protein n=1 Tax=Symbiochloris irregularis TaxID=706552 RepID=A0AAW1PEN6_9CHLO